jgi:NADH dehydrogenase
MTPRTVAVLGGTGFIGTHVVRGLLPTGANILRCARRPWRGEYTPGDVGQVVPLAVDVTDEESVVRAVRGADVVVNLVAILFERRRGAFHAVHVEGARRVARLARAAGTKRLIHFSALGADARSPSLYARTKAAGEAAVRAEFPEATIVRPSVVFGPEDDFFNRFARIARLSPVLPLIGGGHTRFAPVYVGDIGRAVGAMVARDGAAGETFELGGPHEYSFRELIELLLRVIGRRRLLVPVPFALASINAWLLEQPTHIVSCLAPALAPRPMLTPDQVQLLHSDSVPSGTMSGLAALGVEPTACEVILPTYLARFRRATARARVQRSGV